VSAAPEQGTVAVRPMGRADLDAVVAVEDAAGGLSWSREMFEAELADPDRRVWVVAEDGSGEVVGYAGVILFADEAHVANVAVHPRWQRQGVGSRLVAAVL
jgi:[ribosomal protein S18]-alanine N-acetyltransferase